MTQRPFDSHPRAMTPFVEFERKAPPEDATHIPGPPRMPTGTGPAVRSDTERSTLPPLEPLEEIRGRLANLEDALIDPTGLLNTLFKALDRKAAERHEETMRTLTTLANGVAELSDRVAKLEPEVQTHEARLRLVELAEHAANGSAE